MADALPEPGTEHPGDGPAALTIDDVRVTYGDHTAVAGVSLTVAAGTWTALIGPNGAGKTSLLHAITGAVPATGQVTVAGDDLLSAPPRRRARRVALVPQRPVIPDEMTVTDYVLLGRTAHLPYLGVEGGGDLQIAADTLARLHLHAFAQRPVQTLSGGEQQRVVLARALVQQTPVLLLDEPTAALDIGHRQQVLELVDRLRTECELTVLAAMHDLTMAAQFADRFVLLDDGGIAADGAPAQVLTPDRIAEHFDADVHVVTAPDGGLALIPARSTARETGR
ncbi:MAG: ABC transporter ATP-binding protein [Actinobacteria bacterium]|nr:ABC transporter ATP-binding protein [Actinomycetota bacterium]